MINKTLILLICWLCSINAIANTLYMPEGYVNAEVLEFIGVLNSGEQPVEAKCTFYYEDGRNLSIPFVFPAKQRSTIIPTEVGVDFDTPFATVITAEQNLTATLIHYDHGNALGENFSTTTSTVWSLVGSYRDDQVRDFLTIYVTTDDEVEIGITTYPTYGGPTALDEIRDSTIYLKSEGRRRISIPLHELITNDNHGCCRKTPYGIVVKATKPIVAALSHYDNNMQGGYLIMGIPSLGADHGYIAEGFMNSGIIESLNFMTTHSRNSSGSRSFILKVHYTDGLVVELNANRLVNHVGNQVNIWLKNEENANGYSELSLRENIGYWIEYQVKDSYEWNKGNPVPVAANFVHTDHGGINGSHFVSQPAKVWEFAEGYRSSERDNVHEHLLIVNPDRDVTATVKILIYYDDGLEPTELEYTIEPEKKIGVALHANEALREAHPSGGISYGIRIESDVAVVPYLTHYDFILQGSFALNGTPY
ncbi:sensory rhodopsin transducer [Candidatus Halobeggiatoa sp. HSG11]|nr:sensory rhodopsin transducer [Candidatus Halobeggiatoa sp. HSG11]